MRDQGRSRGRDLVHGEDGELVVRWGGDGPIRKREQLQWRKV